jgi:signal transduction histidine kinase
MKIFIKTDKARLEQILENFISNAMKYSPPGTPVLVTLNRAAGYIEIAVKDEGPGIKAHELGQLFKQYSTVSSVPREGENAMGLGLAIVKKIADALGAQVGCLSEKGKGCTFYIRLPKPG